VKKGKELKKLIITLLKMGFSYQEAMNMPENDAVGYLEAYSEVINPEKKRAKTYKVKGRRHRK
jgi:lipopolysaccharide export LptBFGC system permease protein LptF